MSGCAGSRSNSINAGAYFANVGHCTRVRTFLYLSVTWSQMKPGTEIWVTVF